MTYDTFGEAGAANFLRGTPRSRVKAIVMEYGVEAGEEWLAGWDQAEQGPPEPDFERMIEDRRSKDMPWYASSPYWEGERFR